MKVAGADRNRRMITAGAVTFLAVLMGLALLTGFKLATQIRSSITALQTASELQTYPGVIAQQLTALRERLETREYTGQAHVELAGTVRHFNDDLQLLTKRAGAQSPELQSAVQMWQAYSPVLAPVIAFSGEPYVDMTPAAHSPRAAGCTTPMCVRHSCSRDRTLANCTGCSPR